MISKNDRSCIIVFIRQRLYCWAGAGFINLVRADFRVSIRNQVKINAIPSRQVFNQAPLTSATSCSCEMGLVSGCLIKSAESVLDG